MIVILHRLPDVSEASTYDRRLEGWSARGLWGSTNVDGAY